MCVTGGLPGPLKLRPRSSSLAGGHPQWTCHRTAMRWPGRMDPPGAAKAGPPTPAGQADPAERRRTEPARRPTPDPALARLVVTRADEPGDNRPAKRLFASAQTDPATHAP